MAAAAVPTLPTMPEDVQQRIPLQVGAVGLSRTACTCAHWRLVAQAAAEEQIAALLPPFPRGLSNVPWIKALASSERLVAVVGPPPVARTWRQEWKALRMAQAELLAEQRGRAEQYTLSMAMEGMQQLLFEAFEDESGGSSRSGHLAVARETQHHAGSIAYLTAQRGLEPDRAVALALLLSLCSASLARALRTRDVAFAASAHLVTASMRWLALTSPPAPRLYANLHGECARHPAAAPPRRRATPPTPPMHTRHGARPAAPLPALPCGDACRVLCHVLLVQTGWRPRTPRGSPSWRPRTGWAAPATAMMVVAAAAAAAAVMAAVSAAAASRGQPARALWWWCVAPACRQLAASVLPLWPL